jgi:hypothetical protein
MDSANVCRLGSALSYQKARIRGFTLKREQKNRPEAWQKDRFEDKAWTLCGRDCLGDLMPQ